MELLFTSLSTLFIWLPRSPENSSFLLNCLGNDEIYFDFDFLSADSFSSALLVRLEDSDGDGDGDGDDFFQKFGKERKNLLTDLFRRST